MSNYEELMPVSRPSIGKEELEEISKVFDSRWLGLGSWVLKFEEAVKGLTGAKYAVAVNTGTTALHLALDSYGIGSGDEVIVPSLTFAASVQAIMICGARPVFCDVNADTLNMDVDDMAARITPRTKAIMPVHFGGLPCDMDRVIGTARLKNIRVIEDAAHAFGSPYKGRMIGSFGDAACFSFDPIKNITCGEGGAVTTNDEGLFRTMIKKRILGIDKDTWSRYAHKRDWFYNITMLGFRYHMSNINAAIGIVQMRKLNEFIEKKRRIIKIYETYLRGVKGIALLMKDYDSMAPFNYIIKVEESRDDLMAFLRDRKIDSGVHYIPNHIQPFFSEFARALPVTDKVWRQILTLPLYCEMEEKDALRVVSSIKEFFSCRK